MKSENEVLRSEMKTLKQQIKDYETSNDGNILEISSYKSKISDLESKLLLKENNYEEQKQASLNESSKLRKDNEELELEIKTLKEKIKDIEKSKISYCSEISSYKSKITDLESKLQLSENNYERQVQTSRSESAEFRKDNEELKKEVFVLKEQKKKYEDDIKTKEEQINNYENDIKNYKNIVENLEKKILSNEKDFNVQLQEKSSGACDLEKELRKAEEALKSAKEDYEHLVLSSADEKKKLNTLETECASVKEEIAQLMKKNEDLEERHASVTDELKSVKNQKEDLYQKLIESDKTVANLKDEIEVLEKKISELVKLQGEPKEKHESSLKNKEDELEMAEEALKSVKQTYEEALINLKNEKQKQYALESECAIIKEEKAQIVKKNQVLEEKLASVSEDLNESACKEKINTVHVNLEEEKKKTDDLKNINASYECDIAELTKENKELKDKIKSKIDLEELACKKELETVNRELAKSSTAVDENKEKIENMTNVIISYEKEIADLKRQNEELQQSINSKNEVKVSSVKEEFDSATKPDALSELFEEKKEVDQLSNSVASYQKEIAELQEQNFELQDVAKSKNDLTTLYTLVNILEKCEIKAYDNKKEFHSSETKYKSEIKDLEQKNQNKKSSIEELEKDLFKRQQQLKEAQLSFDQKIMSMKEQHEIEIKETMEVKHAVEEENINLKKEMSELKSDENKTVQGGSSSKTSPSLKENLPRNPSTRPTRNKRPTNLKDISATSIETTTPEVNQKSRKRLSDEDFEPHETRASKRVKPAAVSKIPTRKRGQPAPGNDENLSPIQKFKNSVTTKVKNITSSLSTQLTSPRMTRGKRKLFNPEGPSSSTTQNVPKGRKK